MGLDGQRGVVVSKDTPLQRHVAIVGAGPAGLMAAEVIATAGCKVTIFDHMASAARKFLMAGRGGLNLTHSEPIADFLSRYDTAPPRLISAIEGFPPDALVAWVNGLGQETFVGSSGRVFPKVMKASPLLRAWLRRLESLGVTLQLGQRWDGWDETGALQFQDKLGTSQTHRFDAVILALGGASWPRLGSDGRWVQVLTSINVEVAGLKASNAGVLVDWSDVIRSRFAGQPLKRIKILIGGASRMGEAMVTSTGLEGGAVYAMAPQLRAALATGDAQITIDLRPGDTHEILTRALSKPRGKQSQATHLKKTALLTPAAVALLREVGKGALPQAPEDLARLIKAVPVTVRGFAGIDRAISSVGGLAFDALDDNFMIKVLPGTFAAGEMLDWDAPTGGYLLQAAFATGVAAANGALAWLAITRR